MPAPETHLMCSPNWSARWTIQGLRDFEAPGEIERLIDKGRTFGFAKRGVDRRAADHHGSYGR
jgi:hypothetical protein